MADGKRHEGRRYAAIVAALALGAGCSGGGRGGDGAAAADGEFTISVTARTVRAGGEPVVLLARADGAVAWSLSGPGGLSVAEGAETRYVPPAAVAAPTAVEVSAACGGATATAVIQVVPAERITVSGRVLDEDGTPITTEAVLVPGLPPTATASDGTFTIEGVVPPYDLVVVKGDQKIAFVYRGLTRRDPTIFVWRQADDQTRVPDRAAALNGMVSGGGGAGAPAFVNFASPEISQWYDPGANASSSIAAPGPYALELEWAGPITTTGTLLALQYRRDPLSGAPIAYWYAVQPGVTLLAGQPVPLLGPSLALMPAATDTAQGRIVLPARWSLVQKLIGLDFPGGVRFPVFSDTFSLAHLDYLYEVPDIAGAHAQVCACARDDLDPFVPARSITCVARIPAIDPPVRDLRVREAPEPYLPVNGGTGISYATLLSWTAFEGGVHVVQLVPMHRKPATACPGGSCSDDVDIDAAKFVIVTAETSTTIPDLRSIGLGLDPGHDYDWRVRGMGPFESVDDFARYPVAVPPFDLPTAPEPEAFWARSRTYAFETCPLPECFAPVQR